MRQPVETRAVVHVDTDARNRVAPRHAMNDGRRRRFHPGMRTGGSHEMLVNVVVLEQAA